MKFEIYGKNLVITEAMKSKIENKLSFLDKYLLVDEDTIARVVVKTYRNNDKVEVTIPSNIGVLRAEVVHNDFYSAIDLVVDKLEEQVRKQKNKLKRNHKEKLALAFLEELNNDVDTEDDVDEDVVRTKTIKAVMMDVDEAIMRMEMLNHSFFVYTDSETKKIAVVYKRNNGGYGLIETE